MTDIRMPRHNRAQVLSPLCQPACRRPLQVRCIRANDHVNIFLYDGAIVPDPEGIITAGHDNRVARTVAVRQGEFYGEDPNPVRLGIRDSIWPHILHVSCTDVRRDDGRTEASQARFWTHAPPSLEARSGVQCSHVERRMP